jgi:hypothetical protein
LKELLKNIAAWFFIGVLLGGFAGGFGIYRMNSWLMQRSAKMSVLMYYDPVKQMDRIFDLKERL